MTAVTADPAVPGAPDEQKLQRKLGVVGLTAVGFSNIVGSGWLFAALYTAQVAGPAAIVAWLFAGLLCLIIALVIVQLGAARPEAGATVRWPLISSGRLVGSVVGVSVLLTVGATAAEISAILQYASHYLPWLQDGSGLSTRGVLVAMALSVLLSALLSALNWFGVQLFASVNNLITVVKIVVPLLTAAALIVSGFHPGHLTDHGGFAPYGWSAVLSSLAVGGVVYSVNGFQAAADFSGEARDPVRDVPRAVIAGIGLAVLMYLLLQVAFLFAVPDSMLAAHGWNGIDFDSPFGQLALILNLQWVATLLYADAVVSPGGSAYVGVAIDARHSYALAKNGVLPRWFTGVDSRSGIPRRAIALNLVVIVLFLVPSSGWQDLVSVVGDSYLLTYAAVAVAAAVLVDRTAEIKFRGVPPLRVLAPLSFVVASEFVYWSGWSHLDKALPLTLVGVPLFLLARRRQGLSEVRAEIRQGAWLVLFLLALLLMSWAGTFGGHGWVTAPWDTVIVAVLGAITFVVAVRSAPPAGDGAERALA